MLLNDIILSIIINMRIAHTTSTYVLHVVVNFYNIIIIIGFLLLLYIVLL